ncbi:uroporphyrinogen-III synthase HemD [Sclerotinia borealis F-4128]|uniref:Uroporphyrinogen-III synthase HemD n=1 Tax=Sclerotinia borealis (strain F-4128) TaxID=1432307 RepID=W9CM87_SCLBF|nr:uroporphyrinogen-III synthase HemD [Sclerotinia borealis F-4128]
MRLTHPQTEFLSRFRAHLVALHILLEIFGAYPAWIEFGEERHEGGYVGAVGGGGGAGSVGREEGEGEEVDVRAGEDEVEEEDGRVLEDEVNEAKELQERQLGWGTKSVPNDGYEERLEEVSYDVMRVGGKGGERGFEPVFVPVLEHKFVEDGVVEVKRFLRERDIGREEGRKYGGLIFTSQRAVELFARLVEEGRGEGNVSEEWPYLQDVPIYTVGPATSRALRSIPQDPPLNIFGAETGNGEALAHYMLDHYGQWYKDRKTKPPVLFMVGEQRRDIIPKTLMNPNLPNEKRIQVDELVVYGTGVMESFEENFTNLLRDTKDREERWIIVFSPTGCEAMLRTLGMLDTQSGKVKSSDQGESGKRKIFIATIGPTTRDYLQNTFEYEPDVCAEMPSPEGVIGGIRKFWDDKEGI